MKSFTKIQILNPASVDLEINEEPAEALGLREDVHLTGFALGRRQHLKDDDRFEITPTQSFILSSFPLAAWGRLLRASLTYSPVAGGLAAIHQALRSLNLVCHHTHSANGLDLQRSQIVSSEDFLASHLESNQYDLDHLIIPSSLIVFEVPQLSQIPLPDLHEKLLRCIENPPKHRFEAAKALQDNLASQLSRITTPDQDIRVRVDWVSSMETLNRLANWRVKEDEQPPADENHEVTDHQERSGRPFAKSQDQNPLDPASHLARARARKKIPVAIKSGKLTVSMAPWRRLIWPYRSVIPDTRTWEPQDLILAIGHVDINERILLWDLYRAPADPALGTTVVQFEFLSPAGLVESIWWEWVFEELEKAGADILAASSSARTLGHWSRLHITAIFPIDFEAEGDKHGNIAKFLNCFRVLQGIEGEQLHKENKTTFSTRLKVRLDDATEHWKPLENPLYKSTLRNVRVWDCKQGTVTRNYTRRFKRNPFSFTSPLTQETHDRLYQGREYGFAAERTRANLADRVVQSLGAGENVAIVGAHRSGKTSVLNLVEKRLLTDLANEKKYKKAQAKVTETDIPTVIPIRVEASLIIPQGLFAEIHRQVSAVTISLIKQLFNPPELEGLEAKIEFTIPFLKISGAQKRRLKTAVTEKNLTTALNLFLEQLMKAGKDGAGETTVMMLERQLSSLVEALKADSDLLRFVVIIDEVNNVYGSEFKPILQGWRHVIESDRFSKIRWLISTSRPIEKQDLYSPITNVFKEYNVGSLREEETEKLLEAFAAQDASIPEPERKSQLTPVLTFNAGIFIAHFSSRLPYFVQVICYHLFDRSTRSIAPLINRELCYRIISSDVLNEITDYLEEIWSGLPPSVSKPLETKLRDAPNHPRNFLEFIEGDGFRDYQYSARTRKVLIRAGLKGDDQLIIAPIAAFWLITQYLEFPESHHFPTRG